MAVTFTSLVNFKNENLLWNATRDLIHTHPNSYPCFITRVKTLVQMYYFLNNGMLTFI